MLRRERWATTDGFEIYPVSVQRGWEADHWVTVRFCVLTQGRLSAELSFACPGVYYEKLCNAISSIAIGEFHALHAACQYFYKHSLDKVNGFEAMLDLLDAGTPWDWAVSFIDQPTEETV